MARSTVSFDPDFLARFLQDNIPWPEGTHLWAPYGGEFDFEIEGPNVPDAPKVTPVFARVMSDAGCVATKFDHWLPKNPL